MIRRQRGQQFLLISQIDHARLSGQLAEHYGNAEFARPHPRDATIAACATHDVGWDLHDERPTLNRDRRPVDVFEIPLLTALAMWEDSAARVLQEHGPYAGLLVSLHVLGLSAFAGSRPHDNRELFELNKFQHRQYERQDALRRTLGLRSDVPLNLGLAPPRTSPQDDWLAYNFGVLQVVDRLSLAILCATSIFPKIEGIRPAPEAEPLTLGVIRKADAELRVHPWPFAAERLELEIPARPVPAITYRKPGDLQRAYAAAPVEPLRVLIAAA